MLFHSQIFLLVFLPSALAGYYALAHRRHPRMWLVLTASLVFYGYWDARLVPLLAVSICVNWLFARALGRRSTKLLIVGGVALNLGVLGVFKYADFFADTLAQLTGASHTPWSIVLPLGISFFTFQQISYLVDLGRGRAPPYRFDEYALYVAFFPQLIAGPIVRHNELIHQFALAPMRDGMHERLSRGMLLLAIGIAKKVLIADELARIANPLFALAAGDGSLGFAQAWSAALAFTFQIYFDFSSYSDMAIGLGLMFGFSLPPNFDAPLKATSIREFWRRWHMTLTRFLTDYVYVPIGMRLPFGARRDGFVREAVAALATMLLCGLWHGAAWTFAAWGGAHGIALVVNQSWRRARLPMPVSVGWLLTFLFFAASMVLFRAADFSVAAGMLAAMGGLDGWSMTVPGVKDRLFAVLAMAALLSFLAPTSQRLALEMLPPNRWIALLAGGALVYLTLLVGTVREAEFIYFQF